MEGIGEYANPPSVDRERSMTMADGKKGTSRGLNL